MGLPKGEPELYPLVGMELFLFAKRTKIEQNKCGQVWQLARDGALGPIYWDIG